MKKILSLCLLALLTSNAFAWDNQRDNSEERNPLKEFGWEHTDREPASSDSQFVYNEERNPLAVFDWNYTDRVPASSDVEFKYYEERNPLKEF